MKRIYKDVKKNLVIILGISRVKVERREFKKTLKRLSAEREDIKLFLGMTWFRWTNWMIEKNEHVSKEPTKQRKKQQQNLKNYSKWTEQQKY